jgi:hypothetical protein
MSSRAFATIMAGLLVLMVTVESRAAPISLALVPSVMVVTPGDAVSIDLVIGGLGNGVPPSVGAFDIAVEFDLSLLAFTGADFGPYLGNHLAGESLVGVLINGSIVSLAQVSLLLPSELDALQPASFILASLAFDAIAAGTATFSLASIRVDDAFGDKLLVPEPGCLALLAFGLLLTRRCRAGSVSSRRTPPTTGFGDR